MEKRGIVLIALFLNILLIVGCGKEENVGPGVSIVVINETPSTNMPVPTETGQQDTEVFQAD